jgi:RimJ/RimL family protein N-acetyltransferase
VAPATLHSERLILRPWRDSDRAPFAALNADPRVTRMLAGPLDRAGSDALVDRILVGFEANGFGLWAVEVDGGAPFIGFTGLSIPSFEAPFMPAVEIGWRLAFEYWGLGFATEGARCALEFAFGPGGLDQVVSFTTKSNADHPLRPHVLYRLRRSDRR